MSTSSHKELIEIKQVSSSEWAGTCFALMQSFEVFSWKLEQLELELSQSFSKIFIIFVNQKAVGLLLARAFDDYAELIQIGVIPSFRRQGLARALLLTFLESCKSTGLINRIFLEVRKSNIAAISCYESFGFKQLRIRKDYYSNPQEDGLEMDLLISDFFNSLNN